MAKLKELISNLTEILNNGRVTDDYQFTDAQIYFVLRYLRTKLLRQRIQDGKYISPYNYQTIPCLGLEYVKIVDCECYTANCYSLQSKCNLPTIFASSKGLMVNGVYTVNKENPTRLDTLTFDSMRLTRYSKTMKDVKGWFFTPEATKVHIKGFDRLKAVKFSALFTDPLAVMMLDTSCACNDDGSALCLDPYDAEFPMDEDLIKDINTLTYEELIKVAYNAIPDLKNNASPSYAQMDKK